MIVVCCEIGGKFVEIWFWDGSCNALNFLPHRPWLLHLSSFKCLARTLLQSSPPGWFGAKHEAIIARIACNNKRKVVPVRFSKLSAYITAIITERGVFKPHELASRFSS
jgi:hypothetical protein